MKKIFTSLVLILLITLGILAFLEGLCSIIRVARSFHPLLFERSHTKYDPLLGWCNIPNVIRNDLYGPGKNLRINSQGFRNDTDFTKEVPPGKIRIICTGDSFTLGYGVSNEHTFCAQLTKIDQRLETINMGQGGYSVGQSYLWYMRDGLSFDYNIHLVSFITNDFDRLQDNNHGGYATPVFMLKDGKVVVKNYPVSKRSYFWPRLTQNMDTLNGLNIVMAIRKALKMEKFDENENFKNKVLSVKEVQEVIWVMLQDLKEENQKKKGVFVMVLVPTEIDYLNPQNKWRDFIHAYTKENGIPLIDLMDGLDSFSKAQMNEMYAMRHFSQKGNQWFAGEVYKQLKQSGILP